MANAMSDSVLRFKLGKNAKTHAGSYRTAPGGIPSTNNDVTMSRGPTGYVPSSTIQYSFLKGNSKVGDNTRNPSSRPVARALDKQMKDRLNSAADRIGLTRKQIRVNEKTNSGTSIPTTTQFDFTSDYHRLRAEPVAYIKDLLQNPMFLGLAAFVILVITIRSKA